MIQIPSIVVVPGRSRMIVGREMRTMFESSSAMNVPIVVFVSTTYLYCMGHREKAGVDRRVLMYLRSAPPTAVGAHRSVGRVAPATAAPATLCHARAIVPCSTFHALNA